MLQIGLVGNSVGGYGIQNVIGYTRLIGWVGTDTIVLEAFVHLGTAKMIHDVCI